MNTATEKLSKCEKSSQAEFSEVVSITKRLEAFDLLNLVKLRVLCQLIIWALVANALAWILASILILWKCGHDSRNVALSEARSASAFATVLNPGYGGIHGEFAFGTIDGHVVSAACFPLEQNAVMLDERLFGEAFFKNGDLQPELIVFSLQPCDFPPEPGVFRDVRNQIENSAHGIK